MKNEVPTVVLCAVSIVLLASASAAQQPASAIPTFDVVSVKPCDSQTPPTGRRSGAGTSPGRVIADCLSLEALIRLAYVTYANGHFNSASTAPGAPDPFALPEWIRSERFRIEAKVDGTPPVAIMMGPMLQTILEDRFKLKIRHETREVPVYELIAAKGGPRLTPMKPGACVPRDPNASPPITLEPGQHWCLFNNGREADDRNWFTEAEGNTLDEIAAFFTQPNRPVINKTGIDGRFAFRLVYEGGGPSFDTAVKDQLGLQMRPAKAPRDFLVIEHAERPTEN